MEDIYVRLRARLDKLGFGYPKTEDGSEYIFLKRFYSPQDAMVILTMRDGYQTAREYADRSELTEQEAEATLYDMSKRGLIYREKTDGVYHYRHIPVVHGTYEFNVNNFSREWVPGLMQALGTSGYREQMYANRNTPFFRAIPGKRDLVDGNVLPLDDIEAILANHTAFALTPCACRTNPRFRDASVCDHPTDTCLTLGGFADYAVENGFGHSVTRDEALTMLWDGIDDDRVIQAINSRQTEVICSCCGCGCGVIRGRKQFANMDLWSNYYCVRDEAKCVQCGACKGHCQVSAIDEAGIDLSHCIGCGLCVHHCEQGAVTLVKKEHTYEPPDTVFDAYDNMSKDLSYVKFVLKWQDQQ